MKAFTSFLAMLAIPAVLSPAFAADAPGVLADYLPYDGSLTQGFAVRTVLDPSLTPYNKMIMEAFNKLPEARKEELLREFDGNKPFPYDEAIFGDKETYAQYIEAVKKTRLEPFASVAVGLRPSGTDKVWKMYSVTKDSAGKLTPLAGIGSFRYDAAKNVWMSGNGELTATPFSADATYAYGAQSGTEWSVERSDKISALRESVRVTKTTNGAAVFIYYQFSEKSTITGANIAQGSYVLYFPVVTDSAGLSKPGQK